MTPLAGSNHCETATDDDADSAAPIDHPAYRLRQMQKALERAQAQDNTAMVLVVLEQAAREVAGQFENRLHTELR